MDSERFQRTIDKFIELYGDRTGEMGDGIHGGLAWIGDTRFMLLASRSDDLGSAGDWRRLSRLAGLAGHLRRPVLLWDLPLQVSPSKLDGDPLLINETIQNSRLTLLKVRTPIISVFERRFPLLLGSELAMVEGAVIVSDKPGTCLSVREHLPPIAAVKSGQHDFRIEILGLLEGATSVCDEDLERRRINQVRTITMQTD